MEREILFRGKRLDNGEWVYGYYCEAEMFDHAGTEYFIIEYSCDGTQHYVDPATVGQYTGLTDKNGQNIFVGDIIKHKCNFFEIRYSIEQARFLAFLPNGVFNPIALRNCEVIGNIHDNPELLEVQG